MSNTATALFIAIVLGILALSFSGCVTTELRYENERGQAFAMKLSAPTGYAK